MIDQHRRIVDNLRNAPSKFYSLDELSQIKCPCCSKSDYQVSRYPASKSKVFAGQILLQCMNCKVAFVPNTRLNLSEYYNEEYAKEFMPRRLYTGKFYAPENPLWALPEKPVQKRAKFFSNLITERLGNVDRILDFGAGEGFFLKEVQAQEKFAVELDVNSQKILQEELGVQLTDLADVENLDVITSLRSLEHLLFIEVEQTLRAMKRAMKPGGMLIIDVPNGAEQLERFGTGELKQFEQLEPHTMFFSWFSLVLLLNEVGFKLELTNTSYSTVTGEVDAAGPTLMFVCRK